MVKPKKISPKLLIIFFLLVAAALVQLAVIAWKLEDIKSEGSINKSSNVNTNRQPSKSQSSKREPFNKARYSINDPSSIWVVVNKGRILPAQYVPADLTTPNVSLRFNTSNPVMWLRRDAARALEEMLKAAANENVHMRLASGYRSYSTQASVYASMVQAYGQAAADRESARAGYSEHQTGWAADVGRLDGRCEFQACFGDTNEGKWLAKNAHKYGFIVRYPSGKEKLTGYTYEPWHLRYAGSNLASELQKTGQTLEQFFELPSYINYASSPVILR